MEPDRMVVEAEQKDQFQMNRCQGLGGSEPGLPSVCDSAKSQLPMKPAASQRGAVGGWVMRKHGEHPTAG